MNKAENHAVSATRTPIGSFGGALKDAVGQPQVMLVSQDLAHARSQFDPSGRSTRRGHAP